MCTRKLRQTKPLPVYSITNLAVLQGPLAGRKSDATIPRHIIVSVVFLQLSTKLYIYRPCIIPPCYLHDEFFSTVRMLCPHRFHKNATKCVVNVQNFTSVSLVRMFDRVELLSTKRSNKQRTSGRCLDGQQRRQALPRAIVTYIPVCSELSSAD